MYILAVQSTSESFQLGLFKNGTLIEMYEGDKNKASALFIPALDALLGNAQIKITDIEACVVNRGPAPFMVIRVLVTTLNGIHQATGLPLIGVDGLALLLDLCKKNGPDYAAYAVFVPAFHDELYYALTIHGHYYTGCAPVQQCAAFIQEKAGDHSMRIAGAGVSAIKPYIEQSLASYDEALLYPTLHDCITTATHQLEQEEYMSMVTPLHLKNVVYNTNE